jgi:hypothetical protein
MLHFAAAAARPALLSLLDLLCHPFPRVRKATAERLYVRLLSLEASAASLPGATQDGIDAAAAAIAETAWDEPLVAVCVPARDALYARFALEPPEGRMGSREEDRAMERGDGGAAGGAGGAGGEGEDLNSYGALFRSAGY